MLHGLYINNKHIDLLLGETGDLIVFNYSDNDVNNPEAIKNSYTRTLRIPGTKNNNAVFNSIFQSDSTTVSWRVNTTTFNPSIRNTFKLYSNGSLLESGYVMLNSITYVKNNPMYEVTLLGLLGDFFYSLMYNENGDELTIKDLVYDLYTLNTGVLLGHTNASGDPTQVVNETIAQHIQDYKDVVVGPGKGTLKRISDNTAPLFRWDSKFIWNSWLLQFTDVYPTDLKLWEQFITAAPVYTGIHDDFDNDHVLVNLNYPQQYNNIYPLSFEDDGRTYTPTSNYAMIHTQRELDQYEIRDIRSSKQVPALKLSWLLKKIAEYSEINNNYKIVFDEDINLDDPTLDTTLNEYVHKSYILLNQIQTIGTLENSRAFDELNTTWNSIDNQLVQYLTINRSSTIDTTSLSFPSFEINIIDDFRPYNFANPSQTITAIDDVNSGTVAVTGAVPTMGEVSKVINYDQWHTHKPWHYWYGFFAYKVEVEVDGVVDDSYTQVHLYSAPKMMGTYTNNTLYNNALENALSEACETLFGTQKYILHEIECENGVRPSDEYNIIIFKNPQSIRIVNLPSTQNLRIKITKDYFNLKNDSVLYNRYGKPGSFKLVDEDYKQKIQDITTISGYRYIFTRFHGTALAGYKAVNDIRFMNLSGGADFKDHFVINGLMGSGSETMFSSNLVNKTMLFNGCSSPFTYLTDWCKLFNLKFRTDIATRTIYITQRKHYYDDNNIIDISKNIDYSRDVVIDPLYIDHNKYSFTLEKDESYARKVYYNTFDKDYSTFDYITNYEFNNETNEVFEDNILTTAVDYILRSPYLNTGLTRDNVQYPTPALMPKYDYYLWNNNESQSKLMFGLQSFYNLPIITDICTRPCLFDKESKTIDTLNNIVVFNGLYKIPLNANPDAVYRPWLITDGLDIMSKLNDDNECYINSFYDDTIKPYTLDNYWNSRTQAGYISTAQTGVIGLWSFFMPVFNTSNIDLETNKASWTYYMREPDSQYGSTEFDVNSGMFNKWWRSYIEDRISNDSKTFEAYVKLLINPREAMRKFYWFNNCIWVILEITDYDYTPYIDSSHGPIKPCKVKFIRVNNLSSYTT